MPSKHASKTHSYAFQNVPMITPILPCLI